MVSPKKYDALEIVTFQLIEGVTVKEFIDANAEIDDWLVHQPGFQSRRIAELEAGSIVDMLVWDSVAMGTAASERLMSEMAHSPVHAMIDHRSVAWHMVQVLHRTDG